MPVNQYVNKLVKDGVTMFDLTNDTVTPETLAEGITAHDKSGAPIVGVKKIVYGIHINPNESDPSLAVTYLEDAVGMTPAKMGTSTFDYGSWADAFFMPKPCMLKSDGTVDYYLDPNDFTKKEDGSASDVANSSYNGNAMMEFPLIYYKYEQGSATGEGYIYISKYQVDENYKCYSNYDCDGNIIPHFYMACYNGTGTSKLRSLSGIAASSTNGCGKTTGQQEVDRATANNTKSGKVEWYTDVWCDRVLITALLYLMGKSLDLQSTFGNGLVYGGESAANDYVTGTHDTKGLFYGNTGSISATSNCQTAVKVFGIENFWGHTYRRTAGLVTSNYNYKYKMTYSTVDGSTGTGYNSNGSGYTTVTTGLSSNKYGYVSKMQFGNYGLLAVPSTVGSGTANTYYCDIWGVSSSCFAFCGGCANVVTSAAPYCGFCVSLYDPFSGSYWSSSTALSCKPCAE